VQLKLIEKEKSAGLLDYAGASENKNKDNPNNTKHQAKTIRKPWPG